MFDDVVWLPGYELHFEKPELSVDRVELIDNSPQAFVFLQNTFTKESVSLAVHSRRE